VAAVAATPTPRIMVRRVSLFIGPSFRFLRLTQNIRQEKRRIAQ